MLQFGSAMHACVCVCREWYVIQYLVWQVQCARVCTHVHGAKIALASICMQFLFLHKK